jgi:hypothetical protein
VKYTTSVRKPAAYAVWNETIGNRKSAPRRRNHTPLIAR